jgi:hypothetical protein
MGENVGKRLQGASPGIELTGRDVSVHLVGETNPQFFRDAVQQNIFGEQAARGRVQVHGQTPGQSDKAA